MFIYTKSKMSQDINQTITNTYYNYWNLSESEFPILDHTVFVTYRIFDFDRPKEPMSFGFHRWAREMVKNLVIQHDDKFWVYDRQPIGMYAMDYDGSRGGKLVDAKVGPHVHSLMVLHPEIKADVEHQLNLKMIQHMSFNKLRSDDSSSESQEPPSKHKFWWAPYNKQQPLERTIEYNLKGIMHQNGFHPGREDYWRVFGPDVSKPFSQEKTVVDRWGLVLPAA